VAGAGLTPVIEDSLTYFADRRSAEGAAEAVGRSFVWRGSSVRLGQSPAVMRQ
jgi:hypothetical protein